MDAFQNILAGRNSAARSTRQPDAWETAKANAKANPLPLPAPTHLSSLDGVLIPGSNKKHDIKLTSNGSISSITASTSPASSPYSSCLVLPSLCHPHIHLDKPHLLTHPSTSHLQPTSGSFTEALSLTSEAKATFPDSRATLLERMNTLVADSVRHGVTSLRAFCEVDATVMMHCVEAGLTVKELWKERCHVQICAFAQDPLFSGRKKQLNQALLEEAVGLNGVDVLGVTPYVEEDAEKEVECIRWAVKISRLHNKALDFHLDYNVDLGKEARVWDVLRELWKGMWFEAGEWTSSGARRTVCLGHCTRLTLFSDEEWARLKDEIGDRPVYFVGLPTSDLFMMGRPEEGAETQDRKRSTLQLPGLMKKGFNCALGANNVGNAFTPFGTGDPLEVARLGVGVYQVGTGEGAEQLFECVSSRAKEAIGLLDKGEGSRRELKEGDSADLLVIGKPESKEGNFYRRRRTVKEVVWDAGSDRQTVFSGKHVVIDS